MEYGSAAELAEASAGANTGEDAPIIHAVRSECRRQAPLLQGWLHRGRTNGESSGSGGLAGGKLATLLQDREAAFQEEFSAKFGDLTSGNLPTGDHAPPVSLRQQQTASD